MYQHFYKYRIGRGKGLYGGNYRTVWDWIATDIGRSRSDYALENFLL